MHILPTQFVASPIHHPDGAVARLAGGMLWFAAYQVWEQGSRRTVPVDAIASQGHRAATLHAAITAPRPALPLGDRTLRFDQPQIAGILNITPDSFSDGGTHVGDPAAAAGAGVDMLAAGAALIDVGGESTRPNATAVWEGDEIARAIPVVERLARGGALVSIDTRKAAVMEAALAAGAAIVNDVSALLWDDRALDVVARAGCPVVLMHSPDPKQGGHGRDAYANVATAVFDWLEARIAAVIAAGIDRARIVADPGIGFGKTLAENLQLLNALPLFHGLGVPLMLGASRKRLIGALSNEAPVDQRLGGSVALAVKGIEAGVQLLRVHDVAETVQAARVWRGLRDQAWWAEVIERAASPAKGERPGPMGSPSVLKRYAAMTLTIDDLQRAMDAAAAALDFEEARRLRDRIALIRGGTDRVTAEHADTSGLARQRPGAMGLGTSQSRPERPAGWTPPRKPDPMTAGRGRRRSK